MRFYMVNGTQGLDLAGPDWDPDWPPNYVEAELVLDVDGDASKEEREAALEEKIGWSPWIGPQIFTKEELLSTERGRASLSAWRDGDDSAGSATAQGLEEREDPVFVRQMNDLLAAGDDAEACRLFRRKLSGLMLVPDGTS